MNVNIALEHCETRPAPYFPVGELILADGTRVGVGGTLPAPLNRLFMAAACGEVL